MVTTSAKAPSMRTEVSYIGQIAVCRKRSSKERCVADEREEEATTYLRMTAANARSLVERELQVKEKDRDEGTDR
ncbi:hypothetical protein PHSY_006445 [Pseudozyma hubeiensis SY62]|uniref:Uncharacterized protein n=1 Tax=Pseudozyma hubeiensis (strain SY62) TaxID=1305764 RepID=R9PLA2_PSEHS|nr:hypothetical protein PHSY_006445 [Pseudozyma hubeiensis SY62]GAC98850.1 hypothetical protein PHSY_006445 [Pseudozyma hubeiensis SY62]